MCVYVFVFVCRCAHGYLPEPVWTPNVQGCLACIIRSLVFVRHTANILEKTSSGQLDSQLRIYTSSGGLLVYNGLVAAPGQLTGSARLEDCCIEGAERALYHIPSVVDSERVSCERAGARHKRTRKASEGEKSEEEGAREREGNDFCCCLFLNSTRPQHCELSISTTCYKMIGKLIFLIGLLIRSTEGRMAR